DVPFTAPADRSYITATATDPQGNTSEVSAIRHGVPDLPAVAVRMVSGRPLVFSAGLGDGIALRDPEAGTLDAIWDLTLSVAVGTLTLSTTDGLTGSGDGTGSLSYTGPLSALNAALQGMTFIPPPGFHGDATLSVDAGSPGASPLQAQLVFTDGLFLV